MNKKRMADKRRKNRGDDAAWNEADGYESENDGVIFDDAIPQQPPHPVPNANRGRGRGRGGRGRGRGGARAAAPFPVNNNNGNRNANNSNNANNMDNAQNVNNAIQGLEAALAPEARPRAEPRNWLPSETALLRVLSRGCLPLGGSSYEGMF